MGYVKLTTGNRERQPRTLTNTAMKTLHSDDLIIFLLGKTDEDNEKFFETSVVHDLTAVKTIFSYNI